MLLPVWRARPLTVGKGAQILSPDQQRLLFVLERKGITQDHGMDRRWNNLLRAGDSVYQAGGASLAGRLAPSSHTDAGR